MKVVRGKSRFLDGLALGCGERKHASVWRDKAERKRAEGKEEFSKIWGWFGGLQACDNPGLSPWGTLQRLWDSRKECLPDARVINPTILPKKKALKDPPELGHEHLSWGGLLNFPEEPQAFAQGCTETEILLIEIEGLEVDLTWLRRIKGMYLFLHTHL